jgi:hypothetical protein
MVYSHPISDFVKNSRDAVINLQGELGNPTHTAQIAVTAVEAATTITSGKRSMILYNTGSKNAYFGATGVASTTGGVIWAGSAMTFYNVKDDFTIYLICAAGESTTVQRVEF